MHVSKNLKLKKYIHSRRENPENSLYVVVTYLTKIKRENNLFVVALLTQQDSRVLLYTFSTRFTEEGLTAIKSH